MVTLLLLHQLSLVRVKQLLLLFILTVLKAMLNTDRQTYLRRARNENGLFISQVINHADDPSCLCLH